jgi:hypothetical protein
MKPTITMREALADARLLGDVLEGESWRGWRAILIAMMGEALEDDERIIFTQLTGRETEPLQRIEEGCFVVGRRGGKSRAMATGAAYIAGLCVHQLVRGETGVLLCVAPDQRQASIVLDYCASIFEQSPILRQLIARRTADTLELTNGISIEVRSASFRRLRGPTYVAVIADEAAFWYSDEFSSNTDAEILNSVRPGLATTGGPLIIASSPYARRGVLWETHRRHFGKNGDPRILVAQGSSRDFNPLLPQSVIDRAMERDRAHATAEYLAEFRSDIESFVSYEVVRACLGDYVEAAPISEHRYSAFVDPSGGSADSFTLAIAHREGERIYIDAIREIQPPFSPEAAINELAALCLSYKVRTIVGDKYAGEFPRELFRKQNVEYRCSDKTKSDLYRDLLPMLNSGRIVLPKSERLVNQLCGLERRVARSGKDSIDHGPGSHDDVANSVAGAAEYASSRHQQSNFRQFTWDGREVFGRDQYGNLRFAPDKPSKLDGLITEGPLKGGYASSR